VARKLVGLGGVILLAAFPLAISARPVQPRTLPSGPTEIKVVVPPSHKGPAAKQRCRGCDCYADQCFLPTCECTLDVSQAWADRMLPQIRQRLVTRFPESGFEKLDRVTVGVLHPEHLVRFGNDEVQGYYGNNRISISSALSRRQAILVLSHEFGHAWHEHHHPKWDKVDDFLVEGFAEWVAMQVLRCYGDGDSAYKIKSSKDPTYGDGLRYFLELEQRGKSELVFDVASRWINRNGEQLPVQPKATATPQPTSDPDSMEDTSKND
jgi:hypothetical protein